MNTACRECVTAEDPPGRPVVRGLLMNPTLAGLLLTLAAVLACGDEPVDPPPPVPVPTTITVSPSAIEFTSVGETARLTAEVRDQFGKVMSVGVAWSSSATGVATVNSSGVVTAETNGVASIVATAGQASGSAAATVAQRVASISVMPAAFSLIAAGSVQMAATAADANGYPMAHAAFSWRSSDTAVVRLTESFVAEAVSVGSAYLVAASRDVEDTAGISVVVPPPVRSVEAASGPANGGSVQGAGSWELVRDEVFTVTLRARGNPGYDFGLWTEGDATLSTDSVYPMQLAGNHTVEAHFPVNPERGKWGPGNTYTDYEFPGAGYETLAWTFLPAADPPKSLSDKGLLHYYAYNFTLLNREEETSGYGYAGFQSDGHMTVGSGNRWGKVVNFSIWGSNAARSDGLVDPDNEECGCHQIMLQYEWVEGRKYRFELREGPSGAGSAGKWWGLWVKDLVTDSVSFVGEARVPGVIDGRPAATMWQPRTSVFGEDLHWWRSRNGAEKFICSDFEASSLAVLDVTAGPEEHEPIEVRPWTNSGQVDVAENGYETTSCHVTVFMNEDGDTQHNVGFWPEPPEKVLPEGQAGTRR